MFSQLLYGSPDTVQHVAGFVYSAVAGFLEIFTCSSFVSRILVERPEAGATRQGFLVASLLVNIARLLCVLGPAKALGVEIAEVVAGLHLSRVAGLGKQEPGTDVIFLFEAVYAHIVESTLRIDLRARVRLFTIKLSQRLSLHGSGWRHWDGKIFGAIKVPQSLSPLLIVCFCIGVFCRLCVKGLPEKPTEAHRARKCCDP